MILRKFPFGPLETNAYLLGCRSTKRAAIIDPSKGSTQALLEAAEKESLSVKKILLTHSHWDHIADAHLLKEKTGALLFVHSLDAENVRNPGSDGIPLFFPIQGVSPDGFLEEGKGFALGNLQIDIIHTPGHSPGSICLYLKEQKVLFSGDTLFKGGIGNIHLPTSNPKAMWESLRKLAALPPETKVYPGHGDETILQYEVQHDVSRKTSS